MKQKRKRAVAVILLICIAGGTMLSGILALLMQFIDFQ